MAFLEKDSRRPGPGVINGGIYVLKREILDLVRELPCSLEQDAFPTLVERRRFGDASLTAISSISGCPKRSNRGRSSFRACEFVQPRS